MWPRVSQPSRCAARRDGRGAAAARVRNRTEEKESAQRRAMAPVITAHRAIAKSCNCVAAETLTERNRKRSRIEWGWMRERRRRSAEGSTTMREVVYRRRRQREVRGCCSNAPDSACRQPARRRNLSSDRCPVLELRLDDRRLCLSVSVHGRDLLCEHFLRDVSLEFERRRKEFVLDGE